MDTSFVMKISGTLELRNGGGGVGVFGGRGCLLCAESLHLRSVKRSFFDQKVLETTESVHVQWYLLVMHDIKNFNR